jgi:hypothetical protein
VPPVHGRDISYAEAFGCGNDGRVDRAERQVVVLRNQLDHAERISGVDGLQHERTAGEVAEEAGLGLPAESRGKQVDDLGDDQGRDEQRPGMRFQQLTAGGVMRVVCVDVRVERAGVDDQRDGDSARMISSTRSEMSLRPLRPAAAALSVRRAPPLPR